MLRVLVVEDEDIIRKGFIHTVDWTDMECAIIGEARNGKEGLDKIQELKPNIVFTDIMMPKMSGMEMLEAAKGVCDFKSVILTSYSEFEYAQKAINLKVFDYLLKPVDEEALRKVVEKMKIEIYEQHTYNTLMENTKVGSKTSLIDLEFYIQKNEKNPYVEKTLQMIKTQYDKKLTVEKIADELGVSGSYLSRKFKEETSQTFLDILHKYRLQKAIELLSEGTYKVYEVSDKTGFSEYKYFCQVFKKYIGSTPTEFVKHKGVVIQKGMKER